MPHFWQEELEENSLFKNSPASPSVSKKNLSWEKRDGVLIVWIISILYLLPVSFKDIHTWLICRAAPIGTKVTDSQGEESACHAGDLSLIPGLGKSLGVGNGNPLQFSSLENPWTKGPGGLQSMGSQRTGHGLVTKKQYGTQHKEISIMKKVTVQFSSVAQSCPTFCDPMNRSTPGLPVHHQLPEFTQTHVHWVSDAIQPSHPLTSPSPAPSPSQHQSLFQWVNSSHQVAKVLEFQL